MSPAIYTPDGNEVTKIVLPDGSTASEVVAPDGSVVFDAGPEIPDSAVNRWPHSEGSGGTLGDTIGSNDGAISGATWVSGTWVNNYALDYDGSDDVTTLASTPITGSQNRTILLSVQTTTTDSLDALTYWGNATDGEEFWITIEDGNKVGVRVFSGTILWDAPNINDGNPHRIAIRLNGSNVADLDAYVDASALAENSVQDIAINTADNYAPTFGARNRGGGTDLYFSGIQDDIVMTNDALSQSEIQDDYDRQPWS